jgi:Uncharacterized conserved protein
MDKGQIQSFVPETVPDLKRSDYLIDMSYEKGMGFADILRLAMKREEKANKLYLDLAQKTDDTDVQKIADSAFMVFWGCMVDFSIYSSIMTCAFAPPAPKLDKPAILGYSFNLPFISIKGRFQ